MEKIKIKARNANTLRILRTMLLRDVIACGKSRVIYEWIKSVRFASNCEWFDPAFAFVDWALQYECVFV